MVSRPVPSLQPASSTQPTEGRASAEGEHRHEFNSVTRLCRICNKHFDELYSIVGATDQLIERLPNIDTQRVDWLEKRATQLDWDYDDDCERTVDEITGNINDREWNEVGRGKTLREAIDKAMALPSPEPKP